MKEKRILDALNDIDERYIEDAAPGRRKKGILRMKRLVTAAALVLMATGAIFWMKDRFTDHGSEGAVTEATRRETAAAITEAAMETQPAEAETKVPQTECVTEAPAETKAVTTEAASLTESIQEESDTTVSAELASEGVEAVTRESVTAAGADAASAPARGDSAAVFFDYYCPLKDCVRIEVLYPASEKTSVIYNEKTITRIYGLLTSCLCRETDAQETDDESPLLTPVSGAGTGFTLAFSKDSFRCGKYRFEIPAGSYAELLQLLEQ